MIDSRSTITGTFEETLPNEPQRLSPTRALLEAVATGDASPAGAMSDLRALVQREPEAVYGALRSLVWTFVAGRDVGGHLQQWAALILRLRQVLRRADSPIAERFTVLADLLDQSSRFPFHQPRTELGGRKNVVAILSVLHARGGGAARGQIQHETKLKNANLSRMLANLASAGLISRQNSGREVFVSLTLDGVAEVRRLGLATAPPKADSDRGALGKLAPAWSAFQGFIAIADPQGAIVDCDANFASFFGGGDYGMVRGRSLHEILEGLDRPDLEGERGTPVEVATPDGRSIRIERRTFEEGIAVLGSDVTWYRRELNDSARRVRILRRRKSRAALLSQAVFEARPSDADVWPMIASVRHDVIEPMTTLKGLVYNLRYELKDPPRSERRDLLDGIVNRVERLSASLRDIVSFNDIMEGDLGSNSIADTKSLVEEVTRGLEHTLKHDGMVIQTYSAQPYVVNTDSQAYRAILFRALSGVVELSGRHGIVSISTSVTSGELITEMKAPSLPSLLVTMADSRGLAFCEAVIRRLGGAFDFQNSTRRGISASFSWPIVAVVDDRSI